MQNLAQCTSQLCYLQTQPSSVTALGALDSSAPCAGVSWAPPGHRDSLACAITLA